MRRNDEAIKRENTLLMAAQIPNAGCSYSPRSASSRSFGTPTSSSRICCIFYGA